MGMSGYVMDKEEEFYDLVTQEIKQSEHVSQAKATAGAVADLYVPHMTEIEVEDIVDEMWNEFWTKIN